MTQPDAHKAKALADALDAWLQYQMQAWKPEHILRDAIKQATKAETIEWLAAIAERYGFKPPEDVNDE